MAVDGGGLRSTAEVGSMAFNFHITSYITSLPLIVLQQLGMSVLCEYVIAAYVAYCRRVG